MIIMKPDGSLAHQLATVTNPADQAPAPRRMTIGQRIEFLFATLTLMTIPVPRYEPVIADTVRQDGQERMRDGNRS